MVREESHLDDMRAAIRGDFERLAERRGAQELLRETAPASGDTEVGSELEPTPPSSRPDTPELEAPARSVGVGESELPTDASDDPEPAPAEETDEREPAHRSWLARLLGL
jgi:hypothetical protein